MGCRTIYVSQRGSSDSVANFSTLINSADAQIVSCLDFVIGIFARKAMLNTYAAHAELLSCITDRERKSPPFLLVVIGPVTAKRVKMQLFSYDTYVLRATGPMSKHPSYIVCLAFFKE